MSARGLCEARAWSLGAIFVLAITSLAAGCSERTEGRSSPAASACVCEPVGAPVVDPTLLAFLSKARAAHHDADLAEQAGDRQRAIRVLSDLALGHRPGGASPSPEVAEVVADTRARLADLRSAQGDFDAALRDIDEGLGLARESTHFRGHLFEVRGVVEERRSKALAEKGDAAGAEAARKDALAAFEKAIEIQDEVIATALEQKGASLLLGRATQGRVDAGFDPRRRPARSVVDSAPAGQNGLIYAVIAGLVAVLTRLPLAALGAVCRSIGALAYVVLARERRLARGRLARGTGRPPRERRVLGAFVQVGALLADTIALLRPEEKASRALRLDSASRDVFREALAEGRGVVFISAHLGPWERMAALLVEEGFPVATVARESYDPRLTALYERVRRPRGVRSIYRGSPGALFAVAREITQGRAVGFLIDLPGRGLPSAATRLFGEEADVPTGPARIALAKGAAVVVGTCAPALGGRGDDGATEVVISRVPTADLPAGPSGESELHARITRVLDARIALWPLAWLGLFAPPRLQRSADPR